MAEADGIRVTALVGEAIRPFLPALAELRIRVFRDFPYLYDGDAAYEAWYLERFAASPEALVVAAEADGRLVGAATAVPLLHEHEDFRAPFERAGIDPASVFYLAESVLMPDWRGRGIGHAFFDQREARAGVLGYARTAFCAVIRPADHPLRPKDYSPLDSFWRKRGYAPAPGLEASFSWKDIGEAEPTTKQMQFWIRGK